VNYSDDYVDDSGLVDVPVASWTTVDLNLSYNFADRAQSSILSDLRLSLSAQNVLDRAPPRVGTLNSVGYSLGYDPSNASPLGRFIAFGLTKQW
jgi:outer membrane receptor protein involved in Fe transport